MSTRTLRAAQFEADPVQVAAALTGGGAELDVVQVATASIGLVATAAQTEALDTPGFVQQVTKTAWVSTVRNLTAQQFEQDVLQVACMGHMYPLVTLPPGSRTLVIAAELRTLSVAAP